MTSLETSAESSRPIEIYEFRLLSDVWYYTSAEDAITLGAIDYEPLEGLQRGSVKEGIDERKQPLSITMPASEPLPMQWIGRVPGAIATVKVHRLQRDEVNFGETTWLRFDGEIATVEPSRDGRYAKLSCVKRISGRDATIPRYTFGPVCGHLHYGRICAVDPAAYTFTGTVSAESGSTLTVDGLGAFSTKFSGGFVQPVAFTDFRTIRKQATDVITLSLPFPQSMIGLQVQCLQGCDRIRDGDCSTEYSNVANHSGFPDHPTRNPAQVGLR